MEPSSTEIKAATTMLKLLQSGPAQDWLSDERYFSFLDRAVNWAKKCIEDDGEAPHAYFIHGRNRTNEHDWIEMPIVFGDWPPPEGKKYEAMQGLGILFAETHPDYMPMCIVHVAEGWQANYSKQEAGKIGQYVPEDMLTPSQRPDKIEVLMVSATSMDQRFSYCNTEMVRDKTGTFTGWGKETTHRYSPTDKPTTPRDASDYLTLNIFMGYFAARAPRANKR